MRRRRPVFLPIGPSGRERRPVLYEPLDVGSRKPFLFHLFDAPLEALNEYAPAPDVAEMRSHVVAARPGLARASL